MKKHVKSVSESIINKSCLTNGCPTSGPWAETSLREDNL